MEDFGAVSVLPPLIALTLALWTKQVYLSLFVGIWLGETILGGWSPVAGLIRSMDGVVGVFADEGRTKIILLSAMIGAFLTFTQYSGGTAGFVKWLTNRGLVKTKRAAGLLAWSIGTTIFIEANIGVYVSGPVSRPIFDKLKISREKLAYILDSTAASIATLVPINSWGAYIIGLLAVQGVDNPLRAMLVSIPFDFYPILAVLLALAVILTGRDFGPMRSAERRVSAEGKVLRDGAEPLVATEVLMLEAKEGVPARALNMLLPVATIIVTVLIVLFLTGDGNMMDGDGTTSVFWGVSVALMVAAVSYMYQGILRLSEVTDLFMRGVGGLIPIVILLLLAFVIGDTCRSLGTGLYIARAAQSGLPAGVIPATLFLVSCVISFSTGTSWGTWAIMFPIAIPMIGLIGLHPGLTVGAVLGGAVFGDHASPISDSTIISSMAAGTDHIDHVRTQLPYALVAAGLTVLLYLVFGYIL
jgi:Na+/H+ antiporter NhaC